MITIERTFTVERGIEEVFDYLADFTHTIRWDPGTVRTTRMDDGPLEPGARFHSVSRFRGRETELDYELTVFDPRSHLTFVGNNRTVTATDDLSFRPSGAGTELRYLAQFDFHGVAKLASPFLKSSLEELADRTVAQLSETLSHA